MAVPIQPGPGFSAGNPQVVVDGRYLSVNSGRTYDVSPDGQRFLLITDARPADAAAASPHLVVVLDWFEEIERLVPAR